MGCGHRSCLSCLQQYLRIEISESRVSISCPECSEPIHPNEIRSILDDQHVYEKYEDFMVRRVLAVDPDTRWCPAPDCRFAVIASECASCPKIKCERPGCNSYFCYHCKAEWHPNQTCDAARAQRSPNIRSSSVSFSQDSQHRDDIKPCPRCQVLIVKLDDGSCNHMMCSVCGAEFCWLCMKEISDLHYLSPSGCTFWGKKPWSRKKKILWQLGTLVGAPVGIALIAGIAVPAMIIGIPVWVGRKLYTRYKTANKHKRNAAIIGGLIASVLISPILAGLAVGIGVPILLFYVYGVVPVSLCRSGGCGVTTSATGVRFEFDDENDVASSRNNPDNTSMDAVSGRVGGVTTASIGEASLSMASGSQVLREADRESASTVALAGSVGTGSGIGQRMEVQADMVSAQRYSISSLSDKSVSASIAADDGAASTRALAGSMLNYKTAGSDSCSCVTNGEDCVSERVRFDDNVSFIAPHLYESMYAEKASIDSSCSSRGRSNFRSCHSRNDRSYDTISNDSIYVDITLPISEAEKPRKSSSTTNTTATLKNIFFHSTLNENKPKSLDDDVIIEVSNETLDKQSLPCISESNIGGSSITNAKDLSAKSLSSLETKRVSQL
ncbi:E3 ubiquitin-protein ligase RNF19A-like isoform X2 [Agrilus planipennis]|nr:E3 ubiquitin-protein ligase RNF19A-like isoform X2 [Agrilus planipennis]XP_018328540.1 E3 ubiquitin-protein ligase RNF19A-like isoform X2 [Agrilus planipennis]